MAKVSSKKVVKPVSKTVKTRVTKRSLIWEHLVKNKSITSLESIRLYSYTRLAAYICEFRKEGHNIVTKPLSIKDKYGNNSIYAQYLLIQ